VAISYPSDHRGRSGAKTPHDDAHTFDLDEILARVLRSMRIPASPQRPLVVAPDKQESPLRFDLWFARMVDAGLFLCRLDFAGDLGILAAVRNKQTQIPGFAGTSSQWLARNR